MNNFFVSPTYRCYWKEANKLHRTDADNQESINKAINMIKMSLMKDSLPYREAVIVSLK